MFFIKTFYFYFLRMKFRGFLFHVLCYSLNVNICRIYASFLQFIIEIFSMYFIPLRCIFWAFSKGSEMELHKVLIVIFENFQWNLANAIWVLSFFTWIGGVLKLGILSFVILDRRCKIPARSENLKPQNEPKTHLFGPVNVRIRPRLQSACGNFESLPEIDLPLAGERRDRRSGWVWWSLMMTCYYKEIFYII